MSSMFLINFKSWFGGGVLCAISPPLKKGSRQGPCLQEQEIDPFSALLSQLLTSHLLWGQHCAREKGERDKEPGLPDKTWGEP